MALVSCKSCGRRVSTAAPRCPGCGGPGPAAFSRSSPAVVNGAAKSAARCGRCGSTLFSYAARFCTKCGFSQAGVRLEARGLQKSVHVTLTRSKVLLGDISVVINPGEFVGVLGASGSGKSTFVDALSGRRPANGTVLYNGLDLYRSFEVLRPHIGYVPQQDIVHRRITIKKALTYTGLLRLPADTPSSELDTRIRAALQRVNLTEKISELIDTPTPLSGGQLKRVNLATELVSEPKVLFLDEPTSGLDADTEEKLMELFASLAGVGKTVICVTHTLNEIDRCNLVVVIDRGRLAYFGPPREMTGFFKVKRPVDVYKVLAKDEQWPDRYQKSELNDEFVVRRLQEGAARIAPVPTMPEINVSGHSRMLDWRQAKILTRRYLDLILADKRTLLLLLLQAPIIGLMMGWIFNPNGPLPDRFRIDRQAMFTMIMTMIWLGCLNSAREVVKELPIYMRERAVNLKIGSYLLSKLIPLAGICALQCVALLAIVSSMVSIPGSVAERGAILFLTGLAATTMGLMVSAFVSSADKAIATIPLLLIPQMILSERQHPAGGCQQDCREDFDNCLLELQRHKGNAAAGCSKSGSKRRKLLAWCGDANDLLHRIHRRYRYWAQIEGQTGAAAEKSARTRIESGFYCFASGGGSAVCLFWARTPADSRLIAPFNQWRFDPSRVAVAGSSVRPGDARSRKKPRNRAGGSAFDNFGKCDPTSTQPDDSDFRQWFGYFGSF